MSASEEDCEEDMEWLIEEYKKRKRKKNSLSHEKIHEIIGITQPESSKNLSSQKIQKTNKGKNVPKKSVNSDSHESAKAIHTLPQQNPYTQSNAATSDVSSPVMDSYNNDSLNTTPQINQHPQQNSAPKHHNYSAKMREIIHKQFKYLFYLKTTQSKTILEMSDIWESKFPNSHDVIIKTQQGFLLKTDNNKTIITTTLKQMVADKILNNFTETAASSRPPRNTPSASYCCVISAVEHEIQDIKISEHLRTNNIEHRYCKRIISRLTNRPTLLIRVITGCLTSYERLLNNGLFYKNRHYAVFTAAPPQPVPLPCNRCQQYTHKTEDCNSPVKCTKCGNNHPDSKCPTQLPPKCVACQSENHAAWSSKCPKRPSQPIEGIPNIPIKSINKKSKTK